MSRKNLFSRMLREYMAKAMTHRDQLVVADIADEFIDAYPDLVEQATRSLVVRAVAAAMKEFCSQDDKGGDQPTLFDGLPVGIVIAPGVIKPRGRCTWADLQVGREERVANIGHAQDRLRRYDFALNRLRMPMQGDPSLTADDAAELLLREDEES
ncbi:hypothetical protein ACFWYW_19775 [Nonomuraea sp. NPDC059023]|uniref:hypothetical protein n=1 Tax=unclassified Nonomuraea TaxID=2593643 RepID=UPI00368ABE36